MTRRLLIHTIQLKMNSDGSEINPEEKQVLKIIVSLMLIPL